MNSKGLTIVELLIVIVIMGVIATFTVHTVDRAVNNAKAESFVNTGNVMINAASKAWDLGDSIWDDDIVTLQELITNDYIKVNQKDPWNELYDASNSFVIYDGEFKVTLVSAYASIGYSTPLASFTRDTIVYATGNGNTVIDGIVESVTGNTNSSITGDDKNDSISITGDLSGNGVITTYGGNDTVSIGDDIRKNAKINTGDGNDTVTIDHFMRGSSQINGGNGDDTITVPRMNFNTKIDAGDGNDTVSVNTLGGNFKGSINLGSGDDVLTMTLSKNQLKKTNGSINGGSGNDILNLTGISSSEWDEISSYFSGFETVNLSDTTINL